MNPVKIGSKPDLACSLPTPTPASAKRQEKEIKMQNPWPRDSTSRIKPNIFTHTHKSMQKGVQRTPSPLAKAKDGNVLSIHQEGVQEAERPTHHHQDRQSSTCWRASLCHTGGRTKLKAV